MQILNTRFTFSETAETLVGVLLAVAITSAMFV